MLHRYTVFFVASSLPLLFASQVAPNMARELDFWLLWFVAMVLVGLPVLFAEFALSARSAATPWQGMQKLTREADASLVWRIFAVLSVLVAILIASSISARIAVGAVSQFPDVFRTVNVPTLGLAAGVSVIALILSLLKARLLPVGMLLILAGSVVALFDSSVSVPMLTAPSLGEWAQAVVLALLCVGVGSGLYWFGGVSIAPSLMQAKKSLTGYILPIWLTQLIFGAFALLAGNALVGQLSFVMTSLGMLLIAAFLLYYAGMQLMARFGMIIGAAVTLVLCMVLSIVPVQALLMALIVLSLIAVLSLAIFSGFVMKISHLRKTLNFGSELRYNLWRVLVRIIVPIAIIVAFVGLVMQWLA